MGAAILALSSRLKLPAATNGGDEEASGLTAH